MIRICSHCGALLLEDAETCSFCDAPLPENHDLSAPVAVGASARVQSHAEEPEWRREVARRLDEYRARRNRGRPGDHQSGLPFAIQTSYEEQIMLQDPRPRPSQRILPRQRQSERVEIRIQPELDFSTAPGERARPQTALVPVASLHDRRLAGLLDAIFLALAYAAFLGLFRSLGGQFELAKIDAAVYISTFFLFFAQYFSLFTTCAGATPGMQLRGLTIVRLDGTLPDTPQLLWRSFGYLLSGVTLMAGFLWALWDEDLFTWQDRISQTYITAAVPIAQSPSYEIPAGHQSFAPRRS